MLNNTGMDKEAVVHTHTHTHKGILLSHKKEDQMRWMNLEPITQSEASQKKKSKYQILTYIYGI